MKLRYSVGTPEDTFRKHDIVFTSVEAADKHADNRQGACCDILFVYGAKTLLHKTSELWLVLDLNDLCNRFNRTYKASAHEIPIYPYFEEFADRLLRFRRMAQKLKEAA